MSISASFGVEIAALKKGLDDARREGRKYKQDMEREGKGLGNAFFGNLGASAKGQFTEALAALGATGGIVGGAMGIKNILGKYDDLADTALKLRESTEVVQRVGAVAELSGSSVEGMAAHFLKLEKALGDVENRKAAEALEHYGLSAERLASLPLDQKVIALSEAFRRARTDGNGYKELLDLMGRSAAELIPLLSQTKESLEAAFAGVAVVSDKDVQQIAKLNDQFDKMLQTLKALAAVQISSVFKLFRFADTAMSKGTDAAFMQLGEEDLEAKIKEKKRANDAAAQAANTAIIQQSAAEEAATKKRETALKRLEDMEKSLRDASIDALPDAEKLAALNDEISAFFADIPDGFEEQFGAGIEGMRNAANEMKELGEFATAEAILKQVQEISRMIDKAEDTQKRIDDNAQKAAEKRKDELAKVTAQEREFMSPSGQLASLKQELQSIFNEAGVAMGDMAALRDKDPEAYGKALANVKAGAGLQDRGVAETVGTVANAVNVLTGKGANQLAQEQRDLLRDAVGYLKTIAATDPNQNQQDILLTFAAP